jgi:hypothetical protein
MEWRDFSPAFFALKIPKLDTQAVAGLDKCLSDTDHKTGSFIPGFAAAVAGMHGVTFRSAGFVNDALEQASNRGVG